MTLRLWRPIGCGWRVILHKSWADCMYHHSRMGISWMISKHVLLRICSGCPNHYSLCRPLCALGLDDCLYRGKLKWIAVYPHKLVATVVGNYAACTHDSVRYGSNGYWLVSGILCKLNLQPWVSQLHLYTCLGISCWACSIQMVNEDKVTTSSACGLFGQGLFISLSVIVAWPSEKQSFCSQVCDLCLGTCDIAPYL